VRASVILALSYGIDHVFGELPDALHPVAWLGSLIGRARTWALRGSRLTQLARGTVIAVAIPSAFAGCICAVLSFSSSLPNVEFVLAVILLKPMFAVRSLRDAAFSVRDALLRDDLVSARRALGSLCSRKADALNAEELVAATIESVAENTSDSIVAPVFFFVFGGVPAAALYRAINTLDAMLGYRGALEYAGKASARLDDLANLVPARITALLLLLASPFAGHGSVRGARILRRDASKTESPNAGWPMATMAGLLGVRLTKINHYVLGDATRPIVVTDITRAWRITSVASTFAFVLAAAAAELLDG
jgi:adenosylcobinamide-phosphate synthase